MIRQVKDNKKQYLDLLLLADEQESMIDRYLQRGEMYVLEMNGETKPVCVCVITDEGDGVFEIKNLATAPEHQRKGYAKTLLQFIFRHYRDRGHTMLVGTGNSPLTVPFYEACGFIFSHQIDNFFVDHYDHPIYEAGQQLIHMMIFKKRL